jgi:hypothetical protein
MTELSPAPEPVSERASSSRSRRGLLVGLVVVLAAAAIPVISALDDGGNGKGPVVKGDATASVRAAVGTTLAAGSYEMDFTMQSTPATDAGPQSQPCAVDPADGPTLPSGPGRVVMLCTPPSPRGSSGFQSSGHAIVNFDPYVMTVTSNTSAGNGITIFVNATTVWQGSNAVPLPEFASTVEGALGQGQGAVAMLGLASKGGYLNLEQEAVAGATTAGTGSVDGVNVSYYDVTLDLTKLADDPSLTDEERTTMQNAIALLREGGYTGTTETIGIDDAGFIREVTATTKYSDGSSSTRHSILSNFGCAPKVYTPDQSAPAVTTTVPCAPPPPAPPATTVAPTSGPATTVAPSTSGSTTSGSTTSVPPTTSTTVPAPTTEPPTSTSEP